MIDTYQLDEFDLDVRLAVAERTRPARGVGAGPRLERDTSDTCNGCGDGTLNGCGGGTPTGPDGCSSTMLDCQPTISCASCEPGGMTCLETACVCHGDGDGDGDGGDGDGV